MKITIRKKWAIFALVFLLVFQLALLAGAQDEFEVDPDFELTLTQEEYEDDKFLDFELQDDELEFNEEDVELDAEVESEASFTLAADSQLYTVQTTVTLDGIPQQGIEVYLESEGGDFNYRTTTTDKNGVAVFQNIPVLTDGFFTVDWVNNQVTDYSGKQENLFFSVPDTSYPDIELYKGYSANIILRLDGRPLRNTQVYVHAFDSNGVDSYEIGRRVRTDEKGNLSLGMLRERDYYISYLESGVFYDSVPFSVPMDSSITLDLSEDPSAEKHTITSQIYLNNELYTEPVEVRLYRVIRYQGYYTSQIVTRTTSNNGTFTFLVPDNQNYCFAVARNDGVHAMYHGRYVDEIFQASDYANIPDIHLEIGHTVSTRVIVNGKPQPNYEVYLDALWEFPNAVTDRNGYVTFNNIATQDDVGFNIFYDGGKHVYYDSGLTENWFSVPSSNYPVLDLKAKDVVIRTTYRGTVIKNKSIGILYENWDYFYDDDFEYDEDVYLSSASGGSSGSGGGGGSSSGGGGGSSSGGGGGSSSGGGGSYDQYRFKTDQNGKLSLKNLAYGSYTLIYQGYESKPFTIGDQTGSTITVELDSTYTGGGGGGGTSSKGGGSGGGGGGSTSMADKLSPSTTIATTATATTTAAPIEKNWAVAQTQSAVKTPNASGNAFVTAKNPSTISLDTMQEMSKTAGSTPLLLRGDNMTANGSVDVRIQLDPSAATKSINLQASTTGLQASTIKARFAQHFSNTLTVIDFAQSGDFGVPVKIAARLDSTLNKDSLVFYSYDAEKNTYKQLENVSYTVDASGYVHFSTNSAGTILIADKPLAKK